MSTGLMVMWAATGRSVDLRSPQTVEKDRRLKEKTAFSCHACGASFSKWSGQCADCGAWNTLVETRVTPRHPRQARQQGFTGQVDGRVRSLGEVEPDTLCRWSAGSSELDRVLGGGLVPAMVVLIGGDPGIGKSTLLLQTVAALSHERNVLYVTGEESLQQISLRAHRLALDARRCRVVAETAVETIVARAVEERPAVLVVDSIQTVFTQALQSAPGSVAQVRESAAQLVAYAKQNNTVLFLVGHVTKDGSLAGPRVLEHMVDTVLYFEGDPNTPYRVIRAMKNRFGAVNELGVFGMTEKGLRPVANPSALFLSRHDEAVSGSVITVTKEGSRPMLVEVQALVAESASNQPRRVAVGLDGNRLMMLLAVLQRHGQLALFGQDVFINVVGGMRLAETACDLPMLLAVVSSFRHQPLAENLVVFGEVGLAGEIRPVQNGLDRLREAQKHGFRCALIPAANRPRRPVEGMDVVAVTRLDQALDFIR